MLTLALLLAAQTAPQPGSIKTFGDWVVACDNVKRCEMTSLFPEEAPAGGQGPQLSIVRETGPGGIWTVEIDAEPAASGVRLRIEGAQAASWTGQKFTGGEALTIVGAIVNGKAAVVSDASGKAIGRISLSGTSAALRMIDAEQGRVGTTTAAVAKGAKPASAVPVARTLPRVAHVRPSGKAAQFSAATRAAMGRQSGCDAVYDGMSDPPPTTSTPLGGGRTLVLIPCGSGAYNFSSAPFVLTGGKASVARFDAIPGWTEAEGIATLVNADFDEKTGVLVSYAKARGLGDCGNLERYVWDGAMFRLIEARAMGECRGSVNWLAVWRAEAVTK